MEWAHPDQLDAVMDYLASRNLQRRLQYRQTHFPSPSVFEVVVLETQIIDLPSRE